MPFTDKIFKYKLICMQVCLHTTHTRTHTLTLTKLTLEDTTTVKTLIKVVFSGKYIVLNFTHSKLFSFNSSVLHKKAGNKLFLSEASTEILISIYNCNVQ